MSSSPLTCRSAPWPHTGKSQAHLNDVEIQDTLLGRYEDKVYEVGDGPDCISGFQSRPQLIPPGWSDVVRSPFQGLQDSIEEHDREGGKYALIQKQLYRNGLGTARNRIFFSRDYLREQA